MSFAPSRTRTPPSVAEHPLHRFDIGASRHSETGRRVSQIVGCRMWHTRLDDRLFREPPGVGVRAL